MTTLWNASKKACEIDFDVKKENEVQLLEKNACTKGINLMDTMD